MRKQLYLLISILLFSLACTEQMPDTNEDFGLVPKPKQIMAGKSNFKINRSTKILYYPDNIELKANAEYLTQLISEGTGYEIEAKAAKFESSDKGSIMLILEENEMNSEEYSLVVSQQSAIIKAKTATGIFYGIQTLRQLLPPEIEKPAAGANVKWEIPGVEIMDEPRYPYRGMMLDVGRYFFPPEFVKRFIDLMALHKMNYFHWHLTEDQGWRIQINKYPRLTEVGAFRDESVVGHLRDKPLKFDGQRYGGFYTQEEIRDVVEYAQTQHITIIPEIEMPGHSLGALASYPELGCTGGPYKVATRWGVQEDVYCAGKEETFQFLEDVLTEVMDLFPGKYIHVGGDESPKVRWEKCPHCQARIKDQGLKDEHELQSYFIKRMEKFLNENGRKLIGWDEILEGGLAPEATVMSWRGTEGGIQAAKELHDVIMSPTTYCYLDYYQGPSEEEPLAIGGFLPLRKVYSYEPTPEELDETEAKHILGPQGNVWTEYIKTAEYAEYMTFPRACAIAEIGWSQKGTKNYDDFLQRLEIHLKRLSSLGVNYHPLTEN